MAEGDDLLVGMERAVADAPENVALRLHLVDLLLDADRPAAALGHIETILRLEPDDERVWDVRRRAEAALGIGEESNTADTAPSSSDRDLDEQSLREPITSGDEADPLFDIVRPEVTLADVAGMETVKERLRLAFLEPMRNEELRTMYGKTLRAGLLLYGPPGCGKTYLAKALAGELGLYFLSVGINDVLDMWVGSSERNLHEIFESARQMAPAVVFIDEIDAIGHRRSKFRADSAGRNVVNQLLSELDGVESTSEGVLVVAATNQPWDVDPALRRPGRFDRVLLVLPPDREARHAIVTAALEDRPADTLDIDRVAASTDGYSGADLVHVVETATEHALADSIRTGAARRINQSDLDRALGEVRASTEAWFRTAKNHAQFANDNGIFDDLLDYIRARRL
ncbi:MAG: ATPase AAA [Acidimicrobiales bacterium]|nr:MAG: ATPase AAA [Acidimicrobiales bacterium]